MKLIEEFRWSVIAAQAIGPIAGSIAGVMVAMLINHVRKQKDEGVCPKCGRELPAAAKCSKCEEN